jgi:imidazolonepropionase
MSSVLIHNARILTLAEGSVPRRGAEARNLSVIERGYIWADGDSHSYGEGDPPSEAREPAQISVDYAEAGYPNTHTIINAGGRVVMPAFVDAHTHACWAGNRLDEWDMKRAGASYLDILNAGGGIMSTVRATRAASDEELRMSLYKRARAMLSAGTCWAEVKSGYGLTCEPEERMLRAISEVDECVQPLMGIRSTALLGHAIDPDIPDFIDRTIYETLPAILEVVDYDCDIDAYCEEGAWSVDDCRRLFERVREEEYSFRVHADQFNSLGMTPLAVEMGARSVDHLEASTTRDLKALAESDTFGVMLPACGFHLDDRYANGRLFMDMGGALVIASNFNPGSAPCFSMPFIISLAVRKLGLTIEEAITACTINAAELLGPDEQNIESRINPCGHLTPIGVCHHFIMLSHTDERMLAYEFGGDPVQLVVSDGRILKWTGDDSTRTIIKP